MKEDFSTVKRNLNVKVMFKVQQKATQKMNFTNFEMFFLYWGIWKRELNYTRFWTNYGKDQKTTFIYIA